MGTNFYWIKNKCDHCGHSPEHRHIGKSSTGWCFALHVIPEEGINSLEDWLVRLAAEGSIVDEYDEPITLEDLIRIITQRDNNRKRHEDDSCIDHGSGTWDLIKGNFS